VDSLPFSPAADNNRAPILAELRRLLAGASSVVEVGAGTGQHAEYFARHLPHLTWQPTEHPSALATLQPRCAAAGLVNLEVPRPLDIAARPWFAADPWPDAIYTANTLHIVSEALVRAFFDACAERGRDGSRIIVYGPFNYDGRFTSESNERFDAWLKARDADSGIRDFEWVRELAVQGGYGLEADRAMPANNRLLCWRRGADTAG
jgi:cyclopropane fatty-acyl-phospholipid synthase-like methyltransferase